MLLMPNLVYIPTELSLTCTNLSYFILFLTGTKVVDMRGLLTRDHFLCSDWLGMRILIRRGHDKSGVT